MKNKTMFKKKASDLTSGALLVTECEGNSNRRVRIGSMLKLSQLCAEMEHLLNEAIYDEFMKLLKETDDEQPK